jgi:TonB-like protein
VETRPVPLVRSPRLRISVAALLGTVLLHGLVIVPLVLDLSLPSPRLPNRTGAGASAATASSEEPVMTAVFINEVSEVERLPRVEPPERASRGLAPLDLPVVVFSPDASPAAHAEATPDESQDSAAVPEAAGDQKQRALLYGRYLGQVQARIERAWMRPRSDIGAPTFSCGARIEQDRQGAVISVKLDHCNGTQRWQQSLQSAIQTASPLPAPPDPSVYADRLGLTFKSEGFQPGGLAEGFEPRNRDTLIADDRYQVRESLEHLADQLGLKPHSKGKEGSDVIHLTIIGSAPERTQPEPTSTLPMEPSPDNALPSSAPQ